MKTGLIVGAIGVSTLGSTAALAAPAATADRAQLAAHLQYGLALDDDETGDLNPYAFGFGVLGGYTLDMNLYVGGVFDFYFGESDDVGVLGASAEASANAWTVQGEVGYDFGVTPDIVLRPKGGIGMTTFNGEACATVVGIGETCEDNSDTEFAFAMAGQFLYLFDPLFFTGQMRFNLTEASGFILSAGLGGAF